MDVVNLIELFFKSLVFSFIVVSIVLLWIHSNLGFNMADIWYSSRTVFSYFFGFLLFFVFLFKHKQKKEKIRIGDITKEELKKEYKKEFVVKIILFFIKIVVIILILYAVLVTLSKDFGIRNLTGFAPIDIILIVGHYLVYLFGVLSLLSIHILIEDWIKILELKEKIKNKNS